MVVVVRIVGRADIFHLIAATAFFAAVEGVGARELLHKDGSVSARCTYGTTLNA